jgi:thymidylate synthase (FAD)
MKIIKASASIMDPDHLIFGLRNIEYGARISHRSEENMNENTWTRFIQNVVVDHGDWSVVEHASCSVIAVMDRGITHEWVRHRLMSFTQESTRFVNYEKKMPPSFIYPIVGVECKACSSEIKIHEEDCKYDRDWVYGIVDAESRYKSLLKKGWRPQEARSVFPNALAAKIMTSANLRSWRHLLLMRTTKEAHPQIRQICDPLLEEFKKYVPLLFDDIIPGETQISNMRKPH